MFRFPHRAASAAASPERTRHLLRRAALFGAGLLLLWVALQLAPKRAPTPTSVPLAETATADDGVVVRSRPASMPTLFSAGNIAVFVLLLGGAGFAFFLRHRAKEDGPAGLSLESMGQMSLAPNQQLRLVRCSNDVLLLGVTSGQITLLKAYDFIEFADANSIKSNGEVDLEGAARSHASPGSGEGSFATLLRQQPGVSFTRQKSEAPC